MGISVGMPRLLKLRKCPRMPYLCGGGIFMRRADRGLLEQILGERREWKCQKHGLRLTSSVFRLKVPKSPMVIAFLQYGAKTCKKMRPDRVYFALSFFPACVGSSGALRIRHNKFCDIFAEVPKTPCSCGPKRNGAEKNTRRTCLNTTFEI